jgi:hypothetical protein
MSIAEHMTALEIVAEMRMERQAFKGSFMLVEGSHDSRRFSKLFGQANWSFVNCWGKPKLIAAIAILDDDRSMRGYVGFADADFDRILGSIILSPNIVYSSSHDFDLDMIRTNNFSRYLDEVADYDKRSKFSSDTEIIEYIASSIIPLTELKLHNVVNDVGLEVSACEWSNCYDGANFNISKLLLKLTKKQAPDGSHVAGHLVRIGEIRSMLVDKWQATNGHDMSCAIGICLLNRLGSRKPRQTYRDEIEMHLRLSFSIEDFRTTSSYAELVAWSTRNAAEIP